MKKKILYIYKKSLDNCALGSLSKLKKLKHRNRIAHHLVQRWFNYVTFVIRSSDLKAFNFHKSKDLTK